MLNDLYYVPRKFGKPQPGWYKKLTNKNYNYNRNELTCDTTMKGVMADNPGLKLLSINKGRKYVPPQGHYKGIMVVGRNQDYHFARQDNRMIKVYRKLHSDINKGLVNRPTNDIALGKLILKYSLKVIPEVKQLAELHGHVFGASWVRDLKTMYKWSKLWSHKPGSTEVTDKDASGKYIIDPTKANWDYSAKGGVNYNKMCCFFIIPSNDNKETYSTGIPNSTNRNMLPKNLQKPHADVTASRVDAWYDSLVRNILRYHRNRGRKANVF